MKLLLKTVLLLALHGGAHASTRHKATKNAVDEETTRLAVEAKGGRGRRVLDYGQDVAKPMPQGHVPRSQVSLLHVSPIGNAYLGSGRLPRPGSPWTSQITGNFHW